MQAHHQFRRQHSDLVSAIIVHVIRLSVVREGGGKLIFLDFHKYRYSSIRHTHLTEEIKQTISTKQTEIGAAITTADKQLIVLEHNIEELSLSNSDDDQGEAAAGSIESKTEALQQQLEEERKAFNASRKVLEELLHKSTEEAIAKAAAAKDQSHSTTITTTFGNQNSGFQAGSINGPVSGLTFGGK